MKILYNPRKEVPMKKIFYYGLFMVTCILILCHTIEKRRWNTQILLNEERLLSSDLILLPKQLVNSNTYSIEVTGVEVVIFDSWSGFMRVNNKLEAESARPCCLFVLYPSFSAQGTIKFEYGKGNEISYQIFSTDNGVYIIRNPLS